MEKYLILFLASMMLIIAAVLPLLVVVLFRPRKLMWMLIGSLLWILFVFCGMLKAVIVIGNFTKKDLNFSGWEFLAIISGYFFGYLVTKYGFQYWEKRLKRKRYQKFLDSLNEDEINRRLNIKGNPLEVMELHEWLTANLYRGDENMVSGDDFRYEIQMYLYAKGTKNLSPEVVAILEEYGFCTE